MAATVTIIIKDHGETGVTVDTAAVDSDGNTLDGTSVLTSPALMLGTIAMDALKVTLGQVSEDSDHDEARADDDGFAPRRSEGFGEE